MYIYIFIYYFRDFCECFISFLFFRNDLHVRSDDDAMI